MTRTTARIVLTLALLLPASLFAVEIAPATAVDIIAAMGSDANGLTIRQDDLPDLFTLTSSRIDENATHFFVEQVYKGGRWKDGKAVIEYARDLSYTLVNVYDKQGRRQRIYSVKTQYADHLARLRRQSYEAREATEANGESRETPPAETTIAQKTDSALAGSFEWDDEKGDYVYKGSGAAASRVEESPAPAPRSSRRKRRADRAAEPPAPVESAPVKMTEVASSRMTPPRESAAPAQKGEVVAAGGATWVERKEGTSVPAVTERTTRKSRSSRETRREAPRETVSVPPAPPLPPVPVPAPAPAPVPVPVAEKRIDVVGKPVDVDALPVKSSREREKENAKEKESRSSGSAPILHEEQVPSTEELLADEKPTPKDVDQVAAKPAPPVEERPEPKVDTKPITSESDAWVPKAVKTPTVVEPVIPEPKKVAMLPKKEDPMEKLLRMSENSKTPANQEADAWVPKSTLASGGSEAELSKEIQRAREEERRRKLVAPKAPIRKDINNPEEGVLPVSSFEKFSGPMYGRHREYERRFYPGKLRKSNAPLHDFYVDEVDRKKEFHNIYFYQYQKGKPPRLVAVQRHEKVSFRSNYDIDKEDKGKLSTYN